jgi:hypothetical protein
LAEREIAEWNRQRIETQRHLAEKYRLENQITRAAVVNRAELEDGLAKISAAMRSTITAADIPGALKKDLLNQLEFLPRIVEEAVHAQGRLVVTKGSKNGKSPARERSRADKSLNSQTNTTTDRASVL